MKKPLTKAIKWLKILIMGLVSMEEKLKNMILYVAEKSKEDPAFGLTKLNKILFAADFSYYGNTGNSISDATYIHLTLGPAPRGMKLILNALERERKAEIKDVPFYGRPQRRLIPLAGPDMSAFIIDEIAMIDEVIRKLGLFNGTELSEWTHTLNPWLLTEENEVIPYCTVFGLNKVPISRAAMNWAKSEIIVLREQGKLRAIENYAGNQ